jgi:hypothetical protein
MMKSVHYRDLECVQLSNASLSLLVTRSVGPRLLDLQFQGRENILADLPDATLECPGAGTFRFFGGHRLWHAPEVPHRTYIPDNDPVRLTEINGGVQVEQNREEETGIQKSMRVLLPDDRAVVVIDHQLANYGLRPIDCAPWAITQLRPGGIAILPHPSTGVDPDGVLPNRSIVLWPYTDINNSCIRWGNRFTFVRAKMEEGALKLGFPNPRGWLGYLWKDVLFVKKAFFVDDEEYFDHNASSQCYCNPSFLELETLGPRARIAPGGSVSHREVWEKYIVVTLEISEESIQNLTDQLALDKFSPLLDQEL